MSVLPQSLALRFLTVISLCTLSGCDSIELPESVNETVDRAKNAAVESVESIKHQVTATGSIELDIDEPITTNACYASCLILQGGRPTILQIKSYRDVKGEFYPSVFLHAEVSATSPQQLVGQTYSATLFVQIDKDGTMWCSSRDAPVELNIISVTGDSFEASVTGKKLVNTQTKAESNVTGKISGTFLP